MLYRYCVDISPAVAAVCPRPPVHRAAPAPARALQLSSLLAGALEETLNRAESFIYVLPTIFNIVLVETNLDSWLARKLLETHPTLDEDFSTYMLPKLSPLYSAESYWMTLYCLTLQPSQEGTV